MPNSAAMPRRSRLSSCATRSCRTCACAQPMKHSTLNQRTGHLMIWISDVRFAVSISRAARLSELCSGPSGQHVHKSGRFRDHNVVGLGR
jgi:hypothetical protein